MKLKIQVTKQHIKDAMFCGLKSSAVNTNCAIALAVRDIWPNAAVGMEAISTGGNGGDYLGFKPDINLPSKATEFIREFDTLRDKCESRLNISPITFTIDIPDSVIDRIDISAVERSETLELIN